MTVFLLFILIRQFLLSRRPRSFKEYKAKNLFILFLYLTSTPPLYSNSLIKPYFRVQVETDRNDIFKRSTCTRSMHTGKDGDTIQPMNCIHSHFLADMGWEHVIHWYWKQNLGRLETDWTRHCLTLDLVQLQKLDNLRLLTLDYDDFRHSSSPTRSP